MRALGVQSSFDTPGSDATLVCAFLENLVGEIVVYLGIVVEHFKVGVLEQLCAAFVQQLMNGLLNARVIQLALAGRLPCDQLVEGVTDCPVSVVVDRKDIADLPRLELADGIRSAYAEGG